MLNQELMVAYLLEELKDIKKEMDTITAEYNEADSMGKLGKCIKKDAAENKYYHFWMVCNDLGIITPDHN